VCAVVCCNVLQCVAVCFSAFIVRLYVSRWGRRRESCVCSSVLQCVAVCYGALQCVLVRCSVLQCVEFEGRI